MASLKSNFSGYEIEESEVAEKPSGTFYEFELEKGKTELELPSIPQEKSSSNKMQTKMRTMKMKEMTKVK